MAENLEIPKSASKRKRSMRKLSVEATLDLPMNDDCNELNEERKSLAEQEKSANRSSTRPEEEQDISIVKSMTMEQMQEHMSRCLQLSTENKINTKNAFALKLIDCMTIITKNDDESNFAVMACQLDAGAKIYSSRVDAVHQQVIKLVETCMFADKKKREKGAEEDEGGSENEGEEGEKEKGKRKKQRKKVIATNDQISRIPKETDPKDKFVKLEALPGDILNKAKYCPEDLSLTLDMHKPFWMDWQSYRPTKPQGKVEIEQIEMKNRKLHPKIEVDREVDLSTLPMMQPLIQPKEEDCESSCGDVDMCTSIQDDPVPEADEDSPEIEMVSLAMSRMTTEGSNVVSSHEAIKTLFHDPGESDYHYLKMDNSNFWAGPSYWKRPHGHNAENKKKVLRKKKEPVEVKYSETDAANVSNAGVSGMSSSNKRASKLSKRTMAKWNSKKVTYPQDVHFDPETFYMLFNLNIVASVVNQEDSQKEKEKEENHSEKDIFESEDMFAEDNGSQDFPCDGMSQSSGSSPSFRGFPSTASSSSSIPCNQEGFKGFSSPSGSTSPFDPQQGFKGFESQEKDQGSEASSSKTSPPETNTNVGNCDVYEGENLVPMVKTVKVDPIRIVAKPNRVDMQHLKSIMLNIIRRAIEDRENEMRDEGLASPRGSVWFRDVLTQLFSSEELHHRTREDLTIQMAFLCLLTLTNENNFLLKQDDKDEDFLIMYDPSEVSSEM